MTEITGLEFAQKIVSLWNTTKGSEWHPRAAGFVKARIWQKKEGEIRVYVGEGHLQIKSNGLRGNKIGCRLGCGFKYGIGEEVTEIVKVINQEYTMGSELKRVAKTWRDDDGKEVDQNDQDAVFCD